MLFPENRFFRFIIRFLFLHCDLVQIFSSLYRSSVRVSFFIPDIGHFCFLLLLLLFFVSFWYLIQPLWRTLRMFLKN